MNLTKQFDQIGERLTFQTGDIVFSEGEQADCMFVILSGTIEVMVHEEGNQIELAVLKQDDFLGEMSLLEGFPRSATARARQTSVLVKLTEKQLQQLIQEDYQYAWKIMKRLSSRIRDHNKQMAKKIGVELTDVSNKLNLFMESLKSKIEDVAASAREIDQNETELAEYIKEINETTNKVYSALGQITQISNQSRILGFNAMIEAARSGEHGKGFKVVATEMTKLSEQSKDNADDIKSLSQEIESMMTKISGSSTENTKMSQAQANTTTEMVNTIHDIVNLSESLVAISESLK